MTLVSLSLFLNNIKGTNFVIWVQNRTTVFIETWVVTSQDVILLSQRNGGIVLWTDILHPVTINLNMERRSSQEESPQKTSGSNQYTELKLLLFGKVLGWFIAPGGMLESLPLAAELISSTAAESFTGIQSVDDQVFRSSVNLVISSVTVLQSMFEVFNL